MDSKEYLHNDERPNVLNEDEMDLLWKAEEEKRIRESILSSYTERFLLTTRLYKIQQTLRKAKITHKPFIEKG